MAYYIKLFSRLKIIVPIFSKIKKSISFNFLRIIINYKIVVNSLIEWYNVIILIKGDYMFEPNIKYITNGVNLLKSIPDNSVKLVVFDPEYRQLLDKMKFSNETTQKQKNRCNLAQTSSDIIEEMLVEIERILMPSGYLFYWMDKYMVCQSNNLPDNSNLSLVDMLVWEKPKIGLGFRLRHKSEFLQLFQKPPLKAKTTFSDHSIPDVIQEAPANKEHPHAKPINITKQLIKAVTNDGDLVVDPCAGSFSTLEACKNINRRCISCDIEFGDIVIQSDINKENNVTVGTLKCTVDEFNVLSFIKQNPKITQSELSERLNKSERTIKRIMASLQEKKYINRINGKQKGVWQLLVD